MRHAAGWALALSLLSTSVMAKTDQPNILVIWGDDIGWQNVSAYGMGTLGYTTPRIDSIELGTVSFKVSPDSGAFYRVQTWGDSRFVLRDWDLRGH